MPSQNDIEVMEALTGMMSLIIIFFVGIIVTVSNSNRRVKKMEADVEIMKNLFVSEMKNIVNAIKSIND